MKIENLDEMIEKINTNIEIFKNDDEKLGNKINSLFKNINNIKENTKKINDTTGIIKSISDTTNILSVNASIEAARAGEVGKGFSIVAQEMNTLANTTKASSVQVFELLKELNKRINIISEEVNTINNLQMEQTEAFNKILSDYAEIGEKAEKAMTDFVTEKNN